MSPKRKNIFESMDSDDKEGNFEEALLERINTKYEFKKGCEEGIEERLGRGELGQRILQRSV